jgi:hypothetical protein
MDRSDKLDTVIGKVLQLHGQVHLHSNDGKDHAIKPGEAVHASDTIVTSKGSFAQLLLPDGTTYTIWQDEAILLGGIRETIAPEKEGLFGRTATSIDADSTHHFVRVEPIAENLQEMTQPSLSLAGSRHYDSFVDDYNTVGGLLSPVSQIGWKNSGNDGDSATTGGVTNSGTGAGLGGSSGPAFPGLPGETGNSGDSGSSAGGSGTTPGGSAIPPIVVTPVPGITINPVAQLTSGEIASGAEVVISGTVSRSIPIGNVVTITVDGHSYTGTVEAGGVFGIAVPVSVLADAAADTVLASVHIGGAGSPVIETSRGYNFDSGGSSNADVGVEINPLPVINAADAASSTTIAVTGTVNAPAGVTVTVTVDGHTYSGTVGANGAFSIGVPGSVLAGATVDTLQVSASGSDAAGHSYHGSATVSYSVDVNVPAVSITIDPIAAITASEAGSSTPIAITGTVSGNVPAGDVVRVTVGGHSFIGTVTAEGTYSVTVPGNVLGAATTDTIHASVSVTDTAGNIGTDTAEQVYSVAASAEFGIEINPIATVNGAEATSFAPILITGKVTGPNPAGDLVTLTVDGHSYTGVVRADGTYSIGVPGDVMAAAANYTVSVVSVSITAANGHSAVASATQSYEVELTAPPISVAVDTLAPLTAAQAASSTDIAVTGAVSANVPLGTTVTASVDGHTYTGTVQAGDVFSIGIPGNVLGTTSSGNILVGVSAVDAAGNTANASVELPYAVAPVPPAVTISVDPIPAVTGAEAASGTVVAVTGSVSSNVSAGTTVTITADDETFTGTVTSHDTFSVGVPANVLALGATHGLSASVSITGASGAVGTGSSTISYTVDTGTAAIVAVDPLPVINGATAAASAPVAVTGDVGSNVPAGTVITVSAGGQTYAGTVQSDGSYSVNVPGNVLGSAASDTIEVSVPATDASTANTITQTYTVELTAPPVSVSIGAIGTVTSTEAASSAPVVISGTVSADVPAGTIVTATVDGQTYTGAVQPGGTYSIGVPGTVLAAAPTDNVNVSISTTDAAGNTATASADLGYTVATAAASIDLTVAPIPTVNGAQAASSALIDITGTVSSSAPMAGDTVTVTAGGNTYTGTVQSNGSYSVGVPGDLLANAGSVQIVVTSGSGQSSSTSITEPVPVELTAPPIGVGIDPISTINGAEAASSATIAITGTVSSNVPVGTTVTLVVAGESFTGATQANGTYGIGVPGNLLAGAATDSLQVNVSTIDAAGNTATASDSQTYAVELNAPSIGVSINTIATINGTEAAGSAPIAVTGSVSENVPAGSTVALNVAGQSYTGTVQADGTYSIGIPGNVLAGATSDSIQASVSVTDSAGNTATATATQAYAVELTAPAIGIGIDQISPITLAEAASSSPVAITGTVSSNVPAGDTVTLSVAGNTYTGTVTANHTYSIGVPGNVLANATSDMVQVSVAVTDAAGNTANATASAIYSVYNSSIVVDVALVPLSTINAAMAAVGNMVAISGTVSSNVPAGDIVTLSVGGQSYSATVQVGGTFSTGIPGSVLAGASSDGITASVSVTEPNGQVVGGTSSLAYTVELAAPPISIALNQIATVNAIEEVSGTPITVSGSVSANVPVGTAVAVSVGGQTYTGTVQAGEMFSVAVPGNVLANASSDSITASVSTIDAAGNTATAGTSEAYTVELAAAAISIALNPIATIDGSAAASASLLALTGSVSANVPVGDTVTLTVGGQVYTGLVQAGGTFSIGVPGNVLGAAASVHASVSYVDPAGNTASAGITEAYTVELSAPPISVSVDPLATINAAVAASSNPVDVTGSVSANVPTGTVVTASVDGHVYSGTVGANGTYNIAIPGSALANATSDTVTVSVSTSDAAGNVASTSQTLAYAVELSAPPIAVSINPIATINAAEAASSAAVAGTVSANVPAGDTVTVNAGGNTYTGTVQAGGTFSVSVPGNVLAAATTDSVTASVAATDAAGNTASASATLTYAVELTAPTIGIGINAIATINAAEAASSTPILITGTVSANVPVGDIVTLAVGGQIYSGTVLAGGTYSIGVPGNVLAAAATDSVTASVTTTDAAGNVAFGTAIQTYSVNTVGPSLSIAIDAIVAINGAIAASSNLIAITGTVSANVPAGDIVTLNVGGQTYTGAVAAGGTFSIGVPGTVLGAATTDSVTASVSATDGNGNTGSASATGAYTVELAAPPINIGINPIATINGITGNSMNPVAVSGTVSANVPTGTIVTLSVAGNTYAGAVTAQGTYSIGIPGAVLALATSDTIGASVSTTDAAGNTASASASLAYNVELSGAPVSIAINPIATINGIIAASSNLIAVTGSVSADVPAGDIVSLSISGQTYTGAVSASGSYSIGIPGNVLAAAATDNISASVSVTDMAGNVSSANASLAYNVELAAPAISVSINPIVTINGAMAASSAPVLITGTVSANVAIGTPVSMTVAGNTYTGLVLAGGIYSIGVPGNVLAAATSDNVQVSVATTDAAGNVATANASLGYTVELAAPLISISINPIGLLSSLLTGNIAITGTASANVPAGTLLTLNVGGSTYTGVVQPGGGYSVPVPALVLLAQVLDLIFVSISFTDPAGNVASASASQGYTVDLAGSPSHTTAPIMMHMGHMDRHAGNQADNAIAPHHGHAANNHGLGSLLGNDKIPFVLAPHVQTAGKPLILGLEMHRAALHMSDLFTDHHAPHSPSHAAARPAAMHDPFHGVALHTAINHAAIHVDAMPNHMEWHRSTHIE